MSAQPTGAGRILRWWPAVVAGALALLVFVAGPVLVVVGASTLADARPIPGGVSTTGEVVDVRTSVSRGSNTGSSRTHIATVRFTTDNGETVTFEGTGQPDAIDIGSDVPVSYDPDDPQGAHQIGGNASGWAQLLIGLAMTAADVAFVVGFLRWRRRRRTA